MVRACPSGARPSQSPGGLLYVRKNQNISTRVKGFFLQASNRSRVCWSSVISRQKSTVWERHAESPAHYVRGFLAGGAA